MIQKKTCSKCKRELPVTEFYRHIHARDGLYPQCKSCKNAARRAWAAANPEKHRAAKRRHRERYLAAHPEEKLKRLERLKRFNDEISDEHKRAISARSYQKNKDRLLATAKAWRKANPERYKQLQQTRRQQLTDSYVRWEIAKSVQGLKPAMVPQQLVDLVRVNIQIKRLLKERNK